MGIKIAQTGILLRKSSLRIRRSQYCDGDLISGAGELPQVLSGRRKKKKNSTNKSTVRDHFTYMVNSINHWKRCGERETSCPTWLVPQGI